MACTKLILSPQSEFRSRKPELARAKPNGLSANKIFLASACVHRALYSRIVAVGRFSRSGTALSASPEKHTRNTRTRLSALLGLRPRRAVSFRGDSFCHGLPSVLFSGGECSPRPTPRAAETILRLQFLPPVAGGNHPRLARGPGRFRRAADRRRQVALLPTARARAARPHRRRLAAHRADEGPGGRAAGRRRAGDVFEFVARRRRIASAVARLAQGEFRLLYVAPERLMLSGFLDDLKKWNVNLFAIDEAHCISEWGHDFRPEYRQLSALREIFPGRADDGAHRHRHRARARRHRQAASPARSRVLRRQFQPAQSDLPRAPPRSGAYEQILSFIRARPRESGIIYCQARKTAESLAAKLSADGVKAPPYHAGLTAGERTEQSGGVSPRRGARDLRDHRLRHGHQQTQRPLRDSSRSAEKHRGLLPGNRPRRAATGCPANACCCSARATA